MQRRIALALSLAFTTVVMFSIVALGAQAGFFSDRKSVDASDITSAVPTDVLLAPAATQVDPIVVTDYVYVDEPGPPVGIRAARAAPESVAAAPAPANEAVRASAGQEAAPLTVEPTVEAPAAPTPSMDDRHRDHDDDDEHEDDDDDDDEHEEHHDDDHEDEDGD